MVNQIIQKYVDIFESFIKKNFILEQDYYIYNMDVYKKISFGTELTEFLSELKKYYYKNKYFYIQRDPVTFNEFNTILRQIFKKNNMNVEKKIKYNMSKYQIEYHIHIKNFDE